MISDIPDERAEMLPDWLTVGGAATLLDSPLLNDLPEFGADSFDEAITQTPPPTVTPPPRAIVPSLNWNIVQQDVDHEPNDGSNFRSYRLSVKNSSQTESREYCLEFELQPGVSQVHASRGSTRTKRGLKWNLGVLEPGEEVTQCVRLPINQAGADYGAAPATIRIAHRTLVSARLELSCEAPTVVLAGRPIALCVTITNSGQCPANAVRIAAFGIDPNLPLASETLSVIDAGETRSIVLHPTVGRGLTEWRVIASSGDMPRIHTMVTTVAVEPDVGIALQLPEAVGTDEEVTGRLVVTNRTALPLLQFRITMMIPDEVAFRGASQRGVLSERGDLVEWTIDELAPGAEWISEAKLLGFTPGRMKLVARVVAEGLAEVTATARLTCEVRRTIGGATLAELLAQMSVDGFDDTPERETVPTRDTRVQHLLFRSAGLRFALPITDVREVLRPLPVTPIPGVASWLNGVANIRGDIVTVVELAPFLGYEDTGARGGIVVVRVEGTDAIALVIDEVVGIHPLAADRSDAKFDDRLMQFLAGITLDPAGVIHRLDARAFLAAAETGATTAL
jgi:purine-binding chemotaxis protein CheW